MATPYTTPRYPGVPHPTPSSPNSRTVPRPPIHNPYDKFTQPEFDSWIGGLTGALKRALGREDYQEEPLQPPEQVDREDDVVEDSFAEVKARREAKGKERATDLGGEDQPIEILSDSEEEEENVAEEDEIWDDEYASEEDVSEGSGDLGSEEDADDAHADTSVFVEDEEEPAEGSDAEIEDVRHDMMNELEVDAETLLRDDEDDEDDDAEGENDEESIDEGTEAFPPTEEANQPINLPDSWTGPSTYAEDFYSGGDVLPSSSSSVNPYVLPTEQDDDDDVIEVADPAAETSQPSELPDPWNGSRIYAEDFYSGGDVQESDLRTRLPSPSHLTSRDDEVGMFLTPEGLTPASSRTPETQHADIFDTGVAEDEKEDDMVLPNQDGHLSSGRPDRSSDEGSVEVGSSAIQGSMLQDFGDDPLEELYGDLGNVQSHQHDLDRVPSVFDAAVLNNQNVAQSCPSQSPEAWREDSASPPRPGFNVHVDWNYPPAFPTGRLASRAGHLESSDMPYDNGDEIVEISDDEDDFKHSPQTFTSYDVPAAPGLEDAEEDGDEGLSQEPLVDNERQVDVPVMPVSLEFSADVESEGDATQELALDDIYSDLDLVIPSGGNTLNTAESDWHQPASELSPTQDMLFSQFFTMRSQSVESSFERAIMGGETLLERPTLSETQQPVDTPGLDGSSKDALDSEQQSNDVAKEVTHDYDFAETRPDSVKEDVRVNDNATSGISLSSDSQDDIVSVSGEVIDEVKDYIVEEPSTEGRRTEEPSSRPPTPEIEEVILEGEGDLLYAVPSPVADTGTGSVLPYVVIEASGEVDIADNTNVAGSSAEASTDLMRQAMTLSPTLSSIPERTLEREVTLVSPMPTAEPSAHSSIPDLTTVDVLTGQLSSQPATTHSAGEALVGNGEEEQPSPEVAQESSVHDSVKSDRMLEEGIPMPVSADPGVPDPTGLSHTPIAPLSPRAIQPSFSAMPETAGVHERIESQVDDVFSRASSDAPSHGKSGLFTPLTADNSRQITPEPSGAGVVEDLAGDSPLKIVISADDLETGGIMDHESLSPSREDVATVTMQADEASTNNSERVNASSFPDHTQEELDTSISQAHEAAEPEELELAYPSDQEQAGDAIGVSARDLPVFPQAKEITADIDAEGDVDPDYVSSSALVEAVAASSHSEDDQAVDNLAAGGNAFAPAAVRTSDLSLQDNHFMDESHSEPTNGHRTPEELGSADESMGTRKDQPVENSLSNAGSTITEAGEYSQETYEEMEEPRPLKRKRTSQVLPRRLTRSTSAKEAMKSKPQSLTKLLPVLPENSKGKGKKKQEDNTESDDEDAASQAASHTSESVSVGSTSDVSMLIFSRSRPSSRASSIASAAPSIGSSIAPISPTLLRTTSHHHNVPPAPFIHAHGPLHHHHSRPVLQPQITTERARAASPSIPAPNSVPETSEPGPSQPLPSPPSRKPLPSSPVTRSNCRFHKISLPREENGPRVFFVVPGCSLGNRELMIEEHIEDHGPAILDADTRLVGDIEGVDFSPYLLGILRQLVGVDLLREQEVFYLPQPGEEYRRHFKRKSRIAKTTLSGKARNSISARTVPGAESAVPSARISVVREPRSRAGSASTSGSRRRGGGLSERGSLTTTASVSGSDLSDLSEIEGRDAKRSKLEPEAEQTVQIETEKAESIPKASLVASRRLGTRRSKRLSADAAAYKPDEEPEPLSDEETIPSDRRRKRKGSKRSRAVEPEDGPSQGVAVKKRRLREKTSADKSASDKPA